jgi:nondiscriminating glutamyl-tRNA synthetase
MAPSPTGPIHIGNIHTALFNWLYARKSGGKFVLRFEDTDQARSKPEWGKVIFEEMKWLGLDWDEGPDILGPYPPYTQMERLDMYHEYAQRLLDSGWVYKCYCTPEELDEERKAADTRHEAYQYSGKCRDLTPEQQAKLEAEGRKPALRFRVPRGQTVVLDDLIRGRIEFPTDSIGDFIIMRPSGIPIYNFAVVIDDTTMKITHVIRGEGHIPNTPVQLLIYQALGLTPPHFGHVGHILGSDRQKLSKRNGDAFIGDYRERGYLPEALFNFMALLGWTPPDGREFLTKDEMIELFSLDRITKAPSVFDINKLNWMNGNYIRALSPEELAKKCLPYLVKAGLVADNPTDEQMPHIVDVVKLDQERIVTLADIVEATDFFFKPDLEYNNDARKTLAKADVESLKAATEALSAVKPEHFTVEELEPLCRDLVERLGKKTKEVFQPIRAAITGRIASPPLFDTMVVLGQPTVIARLKAAIVFASRPE